MCIKIESYNHLITWKNKLEFCAMNYAPPVTKINLLSNRPKIRNQHPFLTNDYILKNLPNKLKFFTRTCPKYHYFV